MKKINQIRFYGTGNTLNQPLNLKMNKLASGGAFVHDNIKQLSIQGYPGIKFYINKSIYPIVLGPSGVYHFELDGATKIFHLRFDPESLSEINVNNDAYLIVDYIYEE